MFVVLYFYEWGNIVLLVDWEGNTKSIGHIGHYYHPYSTTSLHHQTTNPKPSQTVSSLFPHYQPVDPIVLQP
jgi:hypothetical protein